MAGNEARGGAPTLEAGRLLKETRDLQTQMRKGNRARVIAKRVQKKKGYIQFRRLAQHVLDGGGAPGSGHLEQDGRLHFGRLGTVSQLERGRVLTVDVNNALL